MVSSNKKLSYFRTFNQKLEGLIEKFVHEQFALWVKMFFKYLNQLWQYTYKHHKKVFAKNALQKCI